MTAPPRVFVSYKSENANEVRAVADELVGRGVGVWFAEYEVRTGNYDAFEADLDANLGRAVAGCSHAVLFTNAVYWSFPFTTREAELAVARCGAGGTLYEVRLPDPPGTAPVVPNVALPANLARLDLGGGWDHGRAVRFLLAALAPAAPPPSPVVAAGRALAVAGNGARVVMRAGGFDVTAADGNTFRGTLAGAPFELRVTIDPGEALLTPWELAVRRDDRPAAGGGLDDRAVYRPLRRRAPEWFRANGIEERGLHLFWAAPTAGAADAAEFRAASEVRFMMLANMLPPDPPAEATRRLGALAATGLDRRRSAWVRAYLLLVSDPGTGEVGQVDVRFALPFTGDPESAFRTFARLAPRLDAAAGTLRYYGRPGMSWDARLTRVGAAAVAAGAALHFTHPEWGPWAAVAAGAAGLVGAALVWNPFPDPPVWPPGEPFRCRSQGWRIDVPFGWHPLPGREGRRLRAEYAAEVVLVPRGRRYPQLAVSSRTTEMKHVGDVEALYAALVGRMRAPAIDRGAAAVAGVPAHFVRTRVPTDPTLQVYRLGFVRAGRYYLFQCTADRMDEDLPTIRQCVASFAFEAGTK